MAPDISDSLGSFKIDRSFLTRATPSAAGVLGARANAPRALGAIEARGKWAPRLSLRKRFRGRAERRNRLDEGAILLQSSRLILGSDHACARSHFQRRHLSRDCGRRGARGRGRPVARRLHLRSTVRTRLRRLASDIWGAGECRELSSRSRAVRQCDGGVSQLPAGADRRRGEPGQRHRRSLSLSGATRRLPAIIAGRRETHRPRQLIIAAARFGRWGRPYADSAREAFANFGDSVRAVGDGFAEARLTERR